MKRSVFFYQANDTNFWREIVISLVIFVTHSRVPRYFALSTIVINFQWSSDLTTWIFDSHLLVIKAKQNVRLRTGHEGPEGLSALDGVDGNATPGHFTRREENRYPLNRRLGRPHGRYREARKILPPPGFDPCTVQPLASNNTNYAICWY
jgi:hypothetical protein